MSDLTLLASDLVAVSVVAFGMYFPRHRRRDMVTALLVLNIGVLSVAEVLSENNVGAGLGLGLFGVLSIIRLRSSELGQQEIAYYFGALCLGLIGGLGFDDDWLPLVLMLAVVLALFIGDHPRLFGSTRRRVFTLDRAYTDEVELRNFLESCSTAA